MPMCINCNIALRSSTLQSFDALDLNPEIVSLIEEWTTSEVTAGDHICPECFELLVTELEKRKEGYASGNKKLGHTSVCVVCGRSVSKRTGRRYYYLKSGSVEHDYFKKIIHPREIPPGALTCHPCWLRAYEQIRKGTRTEPANSVKDTRVDESKELESRAAHGKIRIRTDLLQEVVTVKDAQVEGSEDSESNDVDETDDPPWTPAKSEIPAKDSNTSIILEGYRRTAETSSHCFIPNCSNRERKRVPILLRKKILLDYKIYITSCARVCAEHSMVNDFAFLNAYDFMTDFSAIIIVEMLNLLRSLYQ